MSSQGQWREGPKRTVQGSSRAPAPGLLPQRWEARGSGRLTLFAHSVQTSTVA